MSEESRITLAIVGVAVLCGILIFLLISSLDEEFTCPNWGEVPVVVDGDEVCIPWEQVVDLEPSR